MNSASHLLQPIQTRWFVWKVRAGIRYENWRVRRAFRKEKAFSAYPLGWVSGFTLAILFLGVFFLSSEMGRSLLAKIPEGPPPSARSLPEAEPIQPVKFSEPDRRDKEAPYVLPDTVARLTSQIDSLLPPSSLLSGLVSEPKPILSPRYAVLVHKATSEVLVVKMGPEKARIVERFDASLGEMFGDKLKEGDKRTPDGVYKVIAIEEGEKLPRYYGPRAFVLNYPNSLDRKFGKTGSGIWIHGSGLGKRTPNTRGCVELNDWDVERLSAYAGVETPVLIFPEQTVLPMEEDAIPIHALDADRLITEKEERLARLLAGSES
jgi:hypothetical protein